MPNIYLGLVLQLNLHEYIWLPKQYAVDNYLEYYGLLNYITIASYSPCCFTKWFGALIIDDYVTYHFKIRIIASNSNNICVFVYTYR